MDKLPRVPVVAAFAIAYGRDYEEMLRMYEKLTPEEQEVANEQYNRDNMGYGPEAWRAYLEAQADVEAWNASRTAQRSEVFSNQGGIIEKTDNTVMAFPDSN